MMIVITTVGVVRRKTSNSAIAEQPCDAFRGQSRSPNMVL